jgi:uncharacterized membrane protein
VLLSVALAVIWAPAVVLIGWPLVVAALIAIMHRHESERVIAGLFAVGFLLVLLPEFFYIQDVFGDRMNTVFKLYFQAWLVLSVATAAALVVVAGRVTRPGWDRAAYGGLLLVLATTLPYAWLSAQDWTEHYRERSGLNGERYIARFSRGDAEAIAWVREHARGGDTLIEAPGCSYWTIDGVPMNRVSAFSGVPTIIGWVGHESQWRRGQESDIGPFLDERVAEAQAALDGATDPAGVGQQADFLILGRQETSQDPGCYLTVERDASTIERLEHDGWELAFESADTRVFTRVEADRGGADLTSGAD